MIDAISRGWKENVMVKGKRIVDIYGNKGKVVEEFYDYVRLDTGRHVYKKAIQFVLEVSHDRTTNA